LSNDRIGPDKKVAEQLMFLRRAVRANVMA